MSRMVVEQFAKESRGSPGGPAPRASGEGVALRELRSTIDGQERLIARLRNEVTRAQAAAKQAISTASLSKSRGRTSPTGRSSASMASRGRSSPKGASSPTTRQQQALARLLSSQRYPRLASVSRPRDVQRRIKISRGLQIQGKGSSTVQGRVGDARRSVKTSPGGTRNRGAFNFVRSSSPTASEPLTTSTRPGPGAIPLSTAYELAAENQALRQRVRVLSAQLHEAHLESRKIRPGTSIYPARPRGARATTSPSGKSRGGGAALPSVTDMMTRGLKSRGSPKTSSKLGLPGAEWVDGELDMLKKRSPERRAATAGSPVRRAASPAKSPPESSTTIGSNAETGSPPRYSNAAEDSRVTLRKMSNAMKSLAFIQSLKEEAESVINVAVRLTGASFVIVYEYCDDEKLRSILSNITDKGQTLCVDVGAGLIGAVAKKRRLENIMDMRRETRYPLSKAILGREIRSMLVVPVVDQQNKIKAVVQLMNKTDRRTGQNLAFSQSDVVLSRFYGNLLSNALSQEHLRARVKLQEFKTSDLFANVKRLFTGGELGVFLTNVIEKTRRLFDAKYALLFRVDKKARELVLVAKNSDNVIYVPQGYADAKNYKGVQSQRVPLSAKSLATLCVKTREKINIKNAREDPRFNTQADEYLAEGKFQLAIWGTQCVLVTPITDNSVATSEANQPSDQDAGDSDGGTGADPEIVGVHIIARTNPRPFTEDEENDIRVYLELMSVCLNRLSGGAAESKDKEDKDVGNIKDLVKQLSTLEEGSTLPDLSPMRDELDKIQKTKMAYNKILDKAYNDLKAKVS